MTARVANALSMYSSASACSRPMWGTPTRPARRARPTLPVMRSPAALPRSQVSDSLLTGAYSATQNRDADASEALVNKMSPLWHAAMFSPAELAAMPEEDVAKIKDVDTFMQLHKRAKLREMEALAIEGTSPVSPSLLFSSDDKDRIARRRVARDDRKMLP